MSTFWQRLRSRAVILVSAFALLAGMNLFNASTASAAYMHLQGNACPGGYILQLIAVTSTESVYGTFADNGWNVHLSYYDGDELVNFAVKCNNNVWYYPTRQVTGFASPRWLGWI